MKSKALIRICQSRGLFHVTYYGVELSHHALGYTREDAYSAALEVSKRESEFNAKRVIAQFGIEGGRITCPEGCIELPSDSWNCKLTKSACRLQASIDLEDREEFDVRCHAPEQKRNEIFQTLLNGKYRGFHHVPGRFLCPSCADTKGTGDSWSYHYHWEMADLSLVLEMDADELRPRLGEARFSNSYGYSRLCAPCCHRIASEIAPVESSELEVLVFRINPK